MKTAQKSVIWIWVENVCCNFQFERRSVSFNHIKLWARSAASLPPRPHWSCFSAAEDDHPTPNLERAKAVGLSSSTGDWKWKEGLSLNILLPLQFNILPHGDVQNCEFLIILTERCNCLSAPTRISLGKEIPKHHYCRTIILFLSRLVKGARY